MKLRSFKFYFLVFVIILIFLSIYTIRWEGFLEYSIFNLAYSISNNKYSIPCNANTSDISVINGKCYSNKFPGLAIFASPWIKLTNEVKEFFSLDNEEKIKNEILIRKKINGKEIIVNKSTFFHRFQIFVVTFFTISIYFIISMCLGFLLSYKILKNLKKAFIFVIFFTFSTLLLPYSSNFIAESFGASLIFISFYFLFSKKNNRKRIIIAGIFSGYALLTCAWSFFIFFGFLLYVFIKIRKKAIYFIFGTFLGSLPLFFYNFSITGNPFIFPFKFQDPQIWKAEEWIFSRETYGFIFDLERIFLNFVQLTILPYRGIFFFYPIYLFLFIIIFLNFKILTKNEKILTLIFFFSFFFSLIVNSMYWYWWGGKIWVNRFLLPIIHLSYFWFFLLFFKIFGNQKFNEIIIITTFFLIYSVFWNFIGVTQPWIEGCTVNLGEGISEYCKKKVEEIEPPFVLWDFYLKTLQEYGFKFRFIESVLNGDIEIRSQVFYK